MSELHIPITPRPIVPLRSLLFCPATEPRRVAKLPQIAPDAAVLDLEDAVSNDRKTSARDDAFAALAQLRVLRTYVRVNNPNTGRTEEDIRAIVQPALDGIVLPKVEDASTVRQVAEWLSQAEAGAGVSDGSTSMLILLESALGIVNAQSILAASNRIETAIFGFVDFMLDIGIDVIDHTTDAQELLYARSSVVIAARAARVSPPLDGPFIDIHAREAFVQQCQQARRMGFRGKMLIHPSQVPLSHAAFTPTPEEIEAAQRIIDEFAKAEAEGVAAVVVDGRLVDYPVVARAMRIVGSSFASRGIR